MLAKVIIPLFIPARYAELYVELERDMQQPYEDEVIKRIQKTYFSFNEFINYYLIT